MRDESSARFERDRSEVTTMSGRIKRIRSPDQSRRPRVEDLVGAPPELAMRVRAPSPFTDPGALRWRQRGFGLASRGRRRAYPPQPHALPPTLGTFVTSATASKRGVNRDADHQLALHPRLHGSAIPEPICFCPHRRGFSGPCFDAETARASNFTSRLDAASSRSWRRRAWRVSCRIGKSRSSLRRSRQRRDRPGLR